MVMAVKAKASAKPPRVDRRPPFSLAVVLASAPVDDEPESDAERAAVDVARDDVALGQLVSLADARTALGL